MLGIAPPSFAPSLPTPPPQVYLHQLINVRVTCCLNGVSPGIRMCVDIFGGVRWWEMGGEQREEQIPQGRIYYLE